MCNKDGITQSKPTVLEVTHILSTPLSHVYVMLRQQTQLCHLTVRMAVSMNTLTERMNQVREHIDNWEWTLTSNTQLTAWPNMVIHPPLKPCWGSPTSHTPQTHWERQQTWRGLDMKMDLFLGLVVGLLLVVGVGKCTTPQQQRHHTHTGPPTSVGRNS